LSLGLALEGRAGIHALAGDTDGVDGQEEIAGAVLAPDRWSVPGDWGSSRRDSLQTTTGTASLGRWGIRW
jgi:glycerate 2-kinase